MPNTNKSHTVKKKKAYNNYEESNKASTKNKKQSRLKLACFPFDYRERI